jgi:hypothetical protein
MNGFHAPLASSLQQFLSAQVKVWKLCWSVLVCLSVLAGTITVQAEPTYSQATRFRIPFDFDARELARLKVREVVLFVSTDRGQTWNQIGSAPPDQGFLPFQAQADGEYWFSVKTLSTGNQLLPQGPHRSSLEVVVDNSPPQIKLEAEQVEPGRVRVVWEVRDQALDLPSLTLEALNIRSARWEPLAVRPSASGQTSWTVEQAGEVLVRARARDLAGNESAADVAVRIESIPERPAVPDLSRPVAKNPVQAPAASRDPAPIPQAPEASPRSFRNVSQTPAIDQAFPLPELRPGPGRSQGASTESTRTEQPPLATANLPVLVNREAPPLPPLAPPALPATEPVLSYGAIHPAERPAGLAAPSAVNNGGQQFPIAASLQAAAAPPALNLNSTQVIPSTARSLGEAGVKPAGTSGLVNSTRFRIEYQIRSVGPSGIRAVHVYITEDGGRKWWHYDLDPDRQSPFDVEVPADGTYGFAFRVENGAGVMASPPQPGEPPAVTVTVDQTAPVVQLLPLDRSKGDVAGMIQLRWTAQDRALAERPVSLFYSSQRSGPWTPIERDLPNNGSYNWLLPTLADADRVYVRIEVRDQAGNVGVQESERPLVIDLSRPAVDVLGVQSLHTTGK